MTLADDGKFCNTCKKVGLQRKAHRIMAGDGGAQCDEHYREISGLPQLNEEAKRFIAQCKEKLADPSAPTPQPPGSGEPAVPKTMRKKLDYKAMQADRDGGMSIAEVAKKYDCSYASVCTNTKQRTDPKPRGPYKKKEGRLSAIAEGAVNDAKKDFGRRADRDKNPDGNFSATIADLKKKREGYQAKIDAIDDVIRTLGELT